MHRAQLRFCRHGYDNTVPEIHQHPERLICYHDHWHCHCPLEPSQQGLYVYCVSTYAHSYHPLFQNRDTAMKRFIRTLEGRLVLHSTLSGWTVVLSPMSGIMIADYFFVRRRQLHLTDLYIGNRTSAYWYTAGFNWRSIVAWLFFLDPQTYVLN